MIQGLKCQALTLGWSKWHPEGYKPVQMTWAFMFLILWKSCLLNCCWINTAASKARQCKPVSTASCQDSREGARVCRSYCFHILLLFIYTGRRSVFPCHPVVAWSSLKSWQFPGSLLPRGSLWSSVSGIPGSGLSRLNGVTPFTDFYYYFLSSFAETLSFYKA